MPKMSFERLRVESGAFFFKKTHAVDPPGPAIHFTLSEPASVSHPPRSSQVSLSPSLANSQALSNPVERQSAQEFARVGNACRIIGTLDFPSWVQIDGEVDGTVRAHDGIILGISGMITTIAPIQAAEVIIAGTVKGDIVASRRIELRATANVSGNLSAPILAIQAGAVVSCYCSTTASKQSSDSIKATVAQGDMR
jgi:cytoskeletal protein CcmA (bactofilin family)